jgi:hypothetical protein
MASATGSAPRTRTPTRSSCRAAEASVKAGNISESRRLAENRNIALQTIHILGKVGNDRYEVDSADILSTLRQQEQSVFTPIPESLTTPRCPAENSAAGSDAKQDDSGKNDVTSAERRTRSSTPTRRFVLKEFQDVPSGLRSYISSSPSKGRLVIPIKTLHVDVNAPLTLPFDPYRKTDSGPGSIGSATASGNKELERIGSRYAAFFQRVPSGTKVPPAKDLCSEKAFNIPDEENPRKVLADRKNLEATRRIAVAKVPTPKPVIDFAPKQPAKVSRGFVPTCANCDLSRRLKIVEEERRAREARHEKLLKIRQTPGSL